ncbi:murein DD-endopeptidase MepM/ murein hydrolase activator NlpD [Rhodococcus sp. OK519]|uniref:M23 family metallopeptidase n=1 Tax=Rhodococcus sp. OK519 TaxID=2135729 RepID=UPI000D3AAF96|nr:murein DD-endopeptidase MepM/ murein hydrolase activator NlpD [Rhodococcus sp. OK519]
MHHRTQFTASRFVKQHADEEPAQAFPAEAGPEATGSGAERSEIRSVMLHHSTEVSTAREDAPGTGEAPTGIAAVSTATDATPPGRGRHRIPTPPTALKGRAAVIAVAAGAVVAAGQAAISGPSQNSDHSEVALDEAGSVATTAMPQAAQFSNVAQTTSTSSAPQVLALANPTDLNQFSNLLAKGQRFSEERAAREAAARRPLFVLPAKGTYTSSFGSRWGTLHAGVDIANAIGTPIYTVADGVVIDSGPASGFGMWVRVQHADGTITVYGHINETLVTVGQKVMAGDQIATMGNRGFSTGPHLHFEVHLAGENKIDPLPWLATRGISLGVEQP